MNNLQYLRNPQLFSNFYQQWDTNLLKYRKKKEKHDSTKLNFILFISIKFINISGTMSETKWKDTHPTYFLNAHQLLI